MSESIINMILLTLLACITVGVVRTRNLLGLLFSQVFIHSSLHP